MRQSSNPLKTWQNSGFPLTIALIAVSILVLLLPIGPDGVAALRFYDVSHLAQPWRLLTYPFVGDRDLRFFFQMFLVYWIFGSLERSWGTRNFAIFYALTTVIGAVVLAIGAYLTGLTPVAHYYIPLASGAVAWGLLNSEEDISIWFIPMKGIYVVFIGLLMLAFTYGQIHPGLIPFSLGGCVFAYYWTRNRSWAYSGYAGPKPTSYAPRLRLVKGKSRPADDRFTLRSLNPFEWFARQRRRRKFERLMKDD